MAYTYGQQAGYPQSGNYTNARRSRLATARRSPLGATPPPGAAPAAPPMPMPSPAMAAPVSPMMPSPQMAPAAAGQQPFGRWNLPAGAEQPEGLDAEGRLQRLGRFARDDYRRAQGQLWQQLTGLRNRANTDRFSDEERSQFLAPTLQNVNNQYQLAQGDLDQSLAERGLTDSSAMVQGQAGLAGQAARFRGQAVNQLYQSEKDRQRSDQAQLMEALDRISGRSASNAIGVAGTLSEHDLRRYLADLQDQGFDITSLLGALGGGIGGLLGGGGLGSLFGGSRRDPRYTRGDDTRSTNV